MFPWFFLWAPQYHLSVQRRTSSRTSHSKHRRAFFNASIDAEFAGDGRG